MRLVNREEMRELDRMTIEDLGTPGLVLMERAGRGVVDALRAEMPTRDGLRVVVVCGKGNNGGDGYVVARELRRRAAEVTVFSLVDPAELRGDARAHYERYREAGGMVYCLGSPSTADGAAAEEVVPGDADGDVAGTTAAPEAIVWDRLRREISVATVLVDAILGTGFQGEVSGSLVDVIEIMNEAPAFTVAVDVPSGLDSNTGAVSDTCVLADLTVTFGCAKLGCFVEPGRAHTGKVEVVDIGIAPEALEEQEVHYELFDAESASLLVPIRQPTDHKGDFGRVLVVGGSQGMTGAVSMAGRAALMAGAGLATVALPESLNDALEAQLVEVMTLPVLETGRRGISVRAVDQIMAAAVGVDAVALGPGMSRDLEPAELVRYLVRELEVPLVLDADGINAFEGRLDELAAARGPVIVTPHVGEMARLCGMDQRAIEAERLELPLRVAEETGLVVLLKGSPTVVAANGMPTAVVGAGNPGMATAGAGDVLTGIILALLGQGLMARDAATLGATVHALAGDAAAAEQGIHGMIAGDILDAVPSVLDELVQCGEELIFG